MSYRHFMSNENKTENLKQKKTGQRRKWKGKVKYETNSKLIIILWNHHALTLNMN